MEALCQLLTQTWCQEGSSAAGRWQRSHELAVEEGCRETDALTAKLHGGLTLTIPALRSPIKRASVFSLFLFSTYHVKVSSLFFGIDVSVHFEGWDRERGKF